jgi:hypothetical protein
MHFPNHPHRRPIELEPPQQPRRAAFIKWLKRDGLLVLYMGTLVLIVLYGAIIKWRRSEPGGTN